MLLHLEHVPPLPRGTQFKADSVRDPDRHCFFHVAFNDQPEFRGLVRPALELASETLDRLESAMHPLRCCLHIELARCAVADGLLASLSSHVRSQTLSFAGPPFLFLLFSFFSLFLFRSSLFIFPEKIFLFFFPPCFAFWPGGGR